MPPTGVQPPCKNSDKNIVGIEFNSAIPSKLNRSSMPLELFVQLRKISPRIVIFFTIHAAIVSIWLLHSPDRFPQKSANTSAKKKVARSGRKRDGGQWYATVLQGKEDDQRGKNANSLIPHKQIKPGARPARQLLHHRGQLVVLIVIALQLSRYGELARARGARVPGHVAVDIIRCYCSCCC